MNNHTTRDIDRQRLTNFAKWLRNKHDAMVSQYVPSDCKEERKRAAQLAELRIWLKYVSAQWRPYFSERLRRFTARLAKVKQHRTQTGLYAWIWRDEICSAIRKRIAQSEYHQIERRRRNGRNWYMRRELATIKGGAGYQT